MLAETIKLSLRTIARNALRSFLTVLGIVIGVGAVIVMVTLGQGTTAQVTSDVAKLGSNLLMVRAGQAGFGPAVAGASSRDFTASWPGCWPTKESCSANRHSRAPTSSSFAASGKSQSCSCKTSPGS